MSTFGPYELVSSIGSGGMAEVWLARRRLDDGGIGKLVALKRMAPGLAKHEKYRRMFAAETRMSMSLGHSNIVQVFDCGTEDEEAYIVMEWIDGVNLAVLMERFCSQGRKIPLPTAMFIIGELLRALDYAHTLALDGARLGVIHRDVSPHNLLLSVAGEVKLTDFGVARLVDEETTGLHPKGKLRYMAPEQLAGRGMDSRLDLFAVGAIAYELVSGLPLRNAELVDELYGQILSGRLPLMPPSLPPVLGELFVSLLQPVADDRIATASDALARLRKWSGYTDARDELATLVRSCVTARVPRPGATGLISRLKVLESDAGVGSTQTRPPTRPVSRDSTPVVATQRLDRLETWPAPNDKSSTVPGEAIPELDADDDAELDVHPRRSQRIWLYSLLAVLSVGGVATTIVWSATRAGTEAISPAGDQSVLAKREPDPANFVQGDLAPSPVPAAIEADEIRPASLVEPDTDERSAKPSEKQNPSIDSRDPKERDGKSRSRSRKKADAAGPSTRTSPKRARPTKSPPVSVTLKSHEYGFAYVRFGSRELVLEPIKRIDVPPGKYPLAMRQSKEEKWRSLGSIEVKSGERLELRLRKENPVRITRISQ